MYSIVHCSLLVRRFIHTQIACDRWFVNIVVVAEMNTIFNRFVNSDGSFAFENHQLYDPRLEGKIYCMMNDDNWTHIGGCDIPLFIHSSLLIHSSLIHPAICSDFRHIKRSCQTHLVITIYCSPNDLCTEHKKVTVTVKIRDWRFLVKKKNNMNGIHELIKDQNHECARLKQKRLSSRTRYRLIKY